MPSFPFFPYSGQYFFTLSFALSCPRSINKCAQSASAAFVLEKATERVFSFQSKKTLEKGQKIFFNDKNIGQILKTINLNGIALIKVDSIPLIQKDPDQIFINKNSCEINFDFHKK